MRPIIFNKEKTAANQSSLMEPVTISKNGENPKSQIFRNTICSFIFLASLLFFIGNFSVYSQQQPDKPKIALVPIDGDRGDATFIKVAEAQITSIMHNSGRLIVVERNNLDKIMKEHNLMHGGLIKDEEAVELGRMSGVQFLVMGKISNVTYTTEWKERTNRSGEKERYQEENGSIGLQINMVDVETGELIYSNLYNFKESNSGTIGGREKLISELLTKKIKKDVRKDILKFFPVEGTILFIDGKKSVMIDIGSNYGIKKGMRVDVITQESRTNASGRTVKIDKTIATLQVVEVTGDDTSVCKISKGEITTLKEGMKVSLGGDESMWSTFGN